MRRSPAEQRERALVWWLMLAALVLLWALIAWAVLQLVEVV